MEETDVVAGSGVGAVWLFMDPATLPEQWKGRAVPAAFVPLLPAEAEQLIGEGRVTPDFLPEGEDFMRLVADGKSAEEIASRLHLSARSAYRRMARLRKHFGVTGTTELAVELARRGFGSLGLETGSRMPSGDGGSSAHASNQERDEVL